MLNKLTNSDLIIAALEKAHPENDPSSDDAEIIDELVVRLQRLEGEVNQWKSAASLAADTPEELERSVMNWL